MLNNLNCWKLLKTTNLFFLIKVETQCIASRTIVRQAKATQIQVRTV
ncbi:MAG: hypothetical protein LBP59_01210 [Planctomycetaceae bacterium]|nr:hypothetical protein [Planctomycetaceae bacterium]